MAKEIMMPALSPSMVEGTLVKWLKKEGDEIKKGDIIAEIETDKATMDLESFDSGTLLKIVLPEGSRVPVNSRIAFIGKPGEKIDETQIQIAAKPIAKKETIAVAQVSSSSPHVKASPLAKKIAKEKGIRLEDVKGTGPRGRIEKKDVELASTGVAFKSVFGIGFVAKEEQIPLSNIRRTIARRLVESKSQIPHFYLEMEINAEELMKTRASLNAAMSSKGIKLSLNDFILKACVDALRKVPQLNVSYEGETLHQHGAVHISFAVAIADGLITPVIRDAHSKSLLNISAEAKKLAARAKGGELQPEEYTGGTFTVSNLGMYGIERFSAIINPPQAAILAVGNIVKKPVINEAGQIVVGERMTLTLSCDHRAVDGALGSAFLKELKILLENPAPLLV